MDTKNLSSFSGQHWALLEMWFANFGLKSEQLPRTPRTSLMDVVSFFLSQNAEIGIRKMAGCCMTKQKLVQSEIQCVLGCCESTRHMTRM